MTTREATATISKFNCKIDRLATSGIAIVLGGDSDDLGRVTLDPSTEHFDPVHLLYIHNYLITPDSPLTAAVQVPSFWLFQLSITDTDVCSLQVLRFDILHRAHLECNVGEPHLRRGKVLTCIKSDAGTEACRPKAELTIYSENHPDRCITPLLIYIRGPEVVFGTPYQFSQMGKAKHHGKPEYTDHRNDVRYLV